MHNRPAFRLKTTCVGWNLFLSGSSLAGFLVMFFSQPSLVVRPVLPEPEFTPAVRAVICCFTLSKAIEYGDTVLLALKKKPLIFLHLYHHVTVTLYCWHAQLVRVSVGHYFAFINLGIHAWMYLYYGLAVLFPRHPVLRSWRPLITVSQILQMCVGLCVAAYALTQGLPADEHFNAAVAVAMYISYAFLFVRFFLDSYGAHEEGRRKVTAEKISFQIRVNETFRVGSGKMCTSPSPWRILRTDSRFLAA
ncbi:UNVERIFIED_CONTAM: hypothetical protein H355_005421 [Colinus virginianus]|nr:hypothetical protein H355_005421 [Colinus virginianus]